jgi:hypothetical protein
MAISELEYFNYAVYISEQFPSFVSYMIGDYGISHFHFVNKPVVQEKTEILLYLGITHIGAIHNLRLASAILPHSEHISYYLYIRPSPIHYTTPLYSTFGLLLLYYHKGTCQAPKHLTARGDIIWIIDTKEDTLYDKALGINLNNQEGIQIKDIKLNQEVADG